MTSSLPHPLSGAPDPGEALLLGAERLLATDPARAVELAQEAGRGASPGSVAALRGQVIEGDALVRLGALEAAQERLAGVAAQGTGDAGHPLAPRYLIALGGLHRSRAETPQACAAFERAVLAARSSRQPTLEAEALNGLAQEQHRVFDSACALTTLERLLTLRRRLGDPAGEAKALCNQALILMAGRDLPAALERLTRALAKLGPGTSPETEQYVRGNFGRLMGQLGQLEAAAEHYARAREVAEATGDRHASTMMSLNLGDIRRQMGDAGSARRLLQEALDGAREVRSPEVEGAALHSLGLLASQQGDHAQAERHLNAAEELARASGDLDGEIDALLGHAHSAVAAGQARRALPGLTRALTLAESGGRLQPALDAHLLLAQVHEPRSPRRAVTHLQAALTLRDRLRDADIAQQVAQLTAQAELETARRRAEHERQLRQVSEAARRHAELTVQELERGRLQDDLTGLPNRLSLHARLPQALEHARREGQALAVAVLDLDRFGEVNNTFGHGAGDELLQQVAVRVAGVLRSGDTLARVGGDEFVLVLPDVGDALPAIAGRIVGELSRGFTLAGQEVMISASLGLSRFPEHGTAAGDLQRAAASALRQAKAAGGGIEVYGGGDGEQQAALALESALFRALERGEFELHYQPLVTACDGRPVAAEALLRWNSATLGRRSPAEFIPLLERTGLIVPVGAWVLREACRAAAGWGGVRVAVNLSARQFARHGELIGSVTRALEESGLPAGQLELEITESLMMQSPERAAQVLQELKDLGVRVMLDDFGTGYSSLSYLSHFPLDGLKIDRSFVDPLGGVGEDRDGAIIRAIVQLCQALSLDVVAEGVETREQHRTLLDLGVRVLQGYHFGRPSAQWRPHTA